MTVPNLITIGRLLLVPLIVWLMLGEQHMAAFAVFLIAGISDAVDGFLARQLRLQSDLGAHLDPIADKALLVSVYVTLTAMAEIPLWTTIVVVSRDILIVGAVILSWVMAKPLAMEPRWVSKINTTFQIVLAAVVLGDLAFGPGLDTLRLVFVYVVGVLTVASAADYLVSWARHMSEPVAPPEATGEPMAKERAS